MLPLRTGSARAPQVNKPHNHKSGVGRKHKSSDGQQQLAAGAEAAVSRQGDHLIGAVAGRDQGGVGRLLAMPFDAGTELPLSLAGATPGLTCETWSTSRGALRCLPPRPPGAAPSIPSAPAVLPAGLSERGGLGRWGWAAARSPYWYSPCSEGGRGTWQKGRQPQRGAPFRAPLMSSSRRSGRGANGKSLPSASPTPDSKCCAGR